MGVLDSEYLRALGRPKIFSLLFRYFCHLFSEKSVHVDVKNRSRYPRRDMIGVKPPVRFGINIKGLQSRISG